MEKICIVKRRREYTQPEVKVTVTQPELSETSAPEVVISSISIESSVATPTKPPEEIVPIIPEFERKPAPEVRTEIPSPPPTKKIVEEFVDHTSPVISIMMTKEQSELLLQSEYIKELLSGKKSDPALEIKVTSDGRLSLSYRISESLLIRMLAPNQVCQMLQVSRSFLQKLIHENKIKSYKLGRMRRFLLEDVLEYLSHEIDFSGFPK